MAEQGVVIVSEDADFAEVVTEQLDKALGLACVRVKDFAGAEGAAVVVTTQKAPELSCPVVKVEHKPGRLQQLLAEVAAALKPAETLDLGGGLRLQLRTRQLQLGEDVQSLTDKEVAIIQCLTEAGAEGLGREALLKSVWGYESVLDTHTLETHIYRLRNKLRELGADDAMIAASEGGYTLKTGTK